MSRKRLLLVGVSVLAVLFACSWALVTYQESKPGVTRANFEKIQMGMTVEEAKVVLGEPVGSSRRFYLSEDHPAPMTFLEYQWGGDGETGCVTIVFAEGRAFKKKWLDPDPLFVRLRRKLGL